MKRLFTQFSFPGGIPSHVALETPGSIHAMISVPGLAPCASSVTSKTDDARRSASRVQISEQARLWLDIFNLFNNAGTHQIDYFYPSQLANETAPVYVVHFKPVELLSVRFTLSVTF